MDLSNLVISVKVGFDEATFCKDFKGRKSDTLILAMSFAGGSDEDEIGLFEQIRGRVMRCEDPWIVYMVDSVKTIQKHFLDKREWFEYTNGTVHETDMDMKAVGCGIILPEPELETKPGKE